MQMEKGKNQHCVQSHQNFNWEKNVPEWIEVFIYLDLYSSIGGQVNNAIFCGHTALILKMIKRNFPYLLLTGCDQ